LTRAGAVPVAPALVLRGLSKSFAGRVAVASIDLVVPRGSFFGMVGPNGAGKTTTLRMATGLLRPDAGTAEVEGIDVWSPAGDASLAAKRRIGVLPEDLQLFDRLTGRQLLTYTGLLRGLPPGIVEERTEELLSVLGLGEAAGTLVVDYSHGMRKKVALAAALLHAPSVLFLDEPFEAIDPVSARTLRAVLNQHRAAGGTIVFSSHVMELVERLCDAVAVVHAGRLVAAGPLADVRRGRTLEEAFVELVGAPVAREEGLEWLGTSSA